MRDWQLAGGNSGRNKEGDSRRNARRHGNETKHGDAVMEADAREARDRLAGVKTSDVFFPKYLTSKNITKQEVSTLLLCLSRWIPSFISHFAFLAVRL